MKRKTIISIFWILLGSIIFGLNVSGVIDDSWGCIGVPLIVVGALQLLRNHRVNSNPAYREKMEIQSTDERIRYIRLKAWGWTGYLFLLITAVASIILKIIGQSALSTAAGFAVCLMLIIYWLSYLLLSRKY